MQKKFIEVRGDFGRVVIVEMSHDLVTHAHEEMQIKYWLSGGVARCRVGKADVTLNQSTIVACNSYQSHDIVLVNPSEPVMALVLYIDLGWLDAKEQGEGKPVLFPASQLTTTPEIREFTATLMHKLMSSSDDVNLCVEDVVLKLIRLTIERTNFMPNNMVYLVRRRMPDYRLRLALAYMKENITNLALMNHVAGVVGVSRSRLYELFLDELQSSPKIIWNSMRLDEAMNRIALTDKSMASVAADLGFSSPGNFSRFFKANTGISPFVYRKYSSIK